MGVRIDFEIGHEASIRTKRTPEGFTHDWEVFVRSPNGDMSIYVEKVVFHLHDTFVKPKRVVKEPPYSVKESGYAGFNLPVEIYLKHSGEPRKITFNYDLGLNSSGPPILHKVPTSYEFHGISDEFKQLLLKGGGTESSSSSRSNEPSSKSLNIDRSGQLVDKPKLGGGDMSRKQKIKTEDLRESNSFLKNFAFVPLPKPTKISPEIRNNQVKSSPKASANIKFEKPVDKTILSKSSKHSPHKDKVDREKKDRDYEKKRDEKRSKDKGKERDRGKDQVGLKRERSPSPRRTPKREPSPKPQISSPKPPSPKMSKQQHDDKKFSSDYKQEKKSKKDKRDKSKDKDRDKREHKIVHPADDKEKMHKPNRDVKPEVKSKQIDKTPGGGDKTSEKAGGKTERSHDTEKHHRKHKKKDREKSKKDEKERERDRDKKHERNKDNNVTQRNDNKATSVESEKVVADNFNSKDKLSAPTTIIADLSNDDSSDSSSNGSLYDSTKKLGVDNKDKETSTGAGDVKDVKLRLEQEKMRKSKKYKEKQHKSTTTSDKDNEKKRKRKLKDVKDGANGDERANKYTKEDHHQAPHAAVDVNSSAVSTAANGGSTSQAPTNVVRNVVDVAAVSGDDESSTQLATTTESYMRMLKSLQESIMAMQDNSDLQQIVQLIARTGQYEITTQTFDFDLCALDRNTVKRLQDFFAIS